MSTAYLFDGIAMTVDDLDEIAVTRTYQGTLSLGGKVHHFTVDQAVDGWGTKYDVCWWDGPDCCNTVEGPDHDKAKDAIAASIVEQAGKPMP